MSFLELVRREMHGSLPKLLIMSGIGGISTAAILAAINSGLQSGSSLWAATLFVIALLLFIKSQYYVTITTTAEIESIIHKIRTRIMDQIRRSELLSIESIGRARIVAAVTSDTAILTQASNMLAFTVQGAVLIVFVAIYVAFLSIAAIVTTIVIVSVAATIFHQKIVALSARNRERRHGSVGCSTGSPTSWMGSRRCGSIARAAPTYLTMQSTCRERPPTSK